MTKHGDAVNRHRHSAGQECPASLLTSTAPHTTNSGIGLP